MTLIAAGLLAPAAPAAAEDPPGAGEVGREAASPAEGYVANQELGARMGVLVSVTGVTPGGVRPAGSFLYRMSDRTWFDGEVGFSFGADGVGCTERVDRSLSCEHGPVDGFSGQALFGARYFLAPRRGDLVPYARGGVGLVYTQFPDDDVGGLAIPLFAGAGGRFRLSEGLTVGGEATFLYGPGFYNQNLGTVGYGALLVQFTVDLAL